MIPDAVDVADGHISVSSPLGRALMEKKEKEKVTVQLPVGVRRLRIVKLVTMKDAAVDPVENGDG